MDNYTSKHAWVASFSFGNEPTAFAICSNKAQAVEATLKLIAETHEQDNISIIHIIRACRELVEFNTVSTTLIFRQSDNSEINVYGWSIDELRTDKL